MAKPKQKIEKHSVRLFKGDFDAMGELYPSLGPTLAIRNLIHKHIEQMEEVRQRQATALPDIDIELDS